MSKYSFIILFLFSFFIVNAQVFDRINVPIKINGSFLNHDNVGGLNSPQFNTIDLNFDGVNDLLIFDRVGNVVLPFLTMTESGNKSYHFAPQYKNNFPTIKNWVLLRDFNGDGINDLFTNSEAPPGIIVYKAKNENGVLEYDLVESEHGDYDIIYYNSPRGYLNLYVSTIDYPDINDIDGDGDLDILTFNPGGGFLEYFKNSSIEDGNGLSKLSFTKVDNCWGKFYESGLGVAVTLGTSPNTCATYLDDPEVVTRHSGSTVLTIDIDNDNDKDLFLGDISFANVNKLVNTGTNQQAYITAQENNFPSNSVPIDINIFPGIFHLDLDFDGKRDFVASVNNLVGSEDVECVWYYKNVGTEALPVFEFQKKTLFIDEMLDLGSACFPTFVDVNQDGLIDIVAGNYNKYLPFGEKNSRLFYFENIGTPSNPSFELKDNDWLSISNYSNLNTQTYTPSFADIDNDGDLDLFIGEEFGFLFYAQNIAGMGNPMQFATPIYKYKNIDIGQTSSPTFLDYNNDGKLDLLVGERSGNINLLINTGTATDPNFYEDPNTAPLPNTKDFGQIDVKGPGEVVGFTTPLIKEINGEYNLFVGSNNGNIYWYKNLSTDPTVELIAETDSLGKIQEGIRTKIDLADIDNDGVLELVVGNMRGGMSFYKTNFQVVSTTEHEGNTLFQVFPNPTSSQIQIKTDHSDMNYSYQISDLFGRRLIEGEFIGHTNISVVGLQSGMYVLSLMQSDKILEIKKIMVTNCK